MSKSQKENKKNPSDLLFERYLKLNGHRKFAYEPKIEGKQKRPDYRLKLKGSALVFDVKEFAAPMRKDKDRDDDGPDGGAFEPSFERRSTK